MASAPQAGGGAAAPSSSGSAPSSFELVQQFDSATIAGPEEDAQTHRQDGLADTSRGVERTTEIVVYNPRSGKKEEVSKSTKGWTWEHLYVPTAEANAMLTKQMVVDPTGAPSYVQRTAEFISVVDKVKQPVNTGTIAASPPAGTWSRGINYDEANRAGAAALAKYEVQNCRDRKAWTSPTIAQIMAMPYLLRPAPPLEGLVLQSPTGTGKTGAFATAMLCAVDRSVPKVQCICVVPNRFVAENHVTELRDIGSLLHKDGKGQVEIEGHWGVDKRDMGKTDERRDFKDARPLFRGKQPHILVITDGKWENYLGLARSARGEKKPPAFDLKEVKLVVIDEADYFTASGKGSGTGNLMPSGIKKIEKTRTKAGLPKPRVVLVSATIPADTDKFLDRFGFKKESFGKTHQVILQKFETVMPKTIHLVHTEVSQSSSGDTLQDKLEYIKGLVLETKPLRFTKCVIFVDTKKEVEVVAAALEAMDLIVAKVHGSPMTKRDQDLGLDRYNGIGLKEGESAASILVATNILGRGITIKKTAHVVLFSPPMSSDGRGGTLSPDYEAFVHRCGRTGRSGEAGIAITLHTMSQRPVVVGKEKSFQARWVPPAPDAPGGAAKPTHGPHDRRICKWSKKHDTPEEQKKREEDWKFYNDAEAWHHKDDPNAPIEDGEEEEEEEEEEA